MDFSTFIYAVKGIASSGPIFSGLIGSVITIWLLSILSKLIPNVYGSKTVEEIVLENKTRVKVANNLFLVSLVGGVALYKYGYFERSDWYGFALIVGVALTSPALFLVVSTIGINKQRVAEAFFAYSVNQKVPIPFLYPLFVIGAFSLVVGFVGVFL